jgi:hypothetical protein
MFFIMLAPFLLWAAENYKFLEQMTEAEWEYVGYQEAGSPTVLSRRKPTIHIRNPWAWR